MGTFVRRAGATLLLLVLAAWLLLGLATRADKVRVSRVLTGSMEPEISVGAMVMARPERAADIEPGEVIQFVPPEPYGPPGGGPVVHRVVDVSRDAEGTVVVHTKGDANSGADPWSLDASRSTVYRVVGHSELAGGLLDTGRRSAATVALCGVALLAAARVLRGLWGPRYKGTHRAPRRTA